MDGPLYLNALVYRYIDLGVSSIKDCAKRGWGVVKCGRGGKDHAEVFNLELNLFTYVLRTLSMSVKSQLFGGRRIVENIWSVGAGCQLTMPV